MSLKDILGRSWRKFEAFAHAMDYDERTDAATRIENLELLQKSSSAALAVAEKRIAMLSGDNATLAERAASPLDSAG